MPAWSSRNAIGLGRVRGDFPARLRRGAYCARARRGHGSRAEQRRAMAASARPLQASEPRGRRGPWLMNQNQCRLFCSAWPSGPTRYALQARCGHVPSPAGGASRGLFGARARRMARRMRFTAGALRRRGGAVRAAGAPGCRLQRSEPVMGPLAHASEPGGTAAGLRATRAADAR